MGGNGAEVVGAALCAAGASGGFAWLKAGSAIIEAAQYSPANTLLRMH
jgi:hypothetical protein